MIKRGDMPATAGGHKVMKRVNQSDPGSDYAQMAYSEPKYKGMTIREQFAMAAMQGMLSNPNIIDQLDYGSMDWIASKAFHQANLMLERTK